MSCFFIGGLPGVSVTLTRPWRELWLRGWRLRHNDLLICKTIFYLQTCGWQWMLRSALCNLILDECWPGSPLSDIYYVYIGSCIVSLTISVPSCIYFNNISLNSFVNSHIVTITVRRFVFHTFTYRRAFGPPQDNVLVTDITAVPCHIENSQGCHDHFPVQSLHRSGDRGVLFVLSLHFRGPWTLSGPRPRSRG